MNQDKVTRLRQLLSEAIPRQPEPTPEAATVRAFQLYEFNTAPAPVLEQTPRARALREIGRIASWYGWSSEIARALDQACTTSLEGLSEDAIERLTERMQRLEQCAQEGLDAPDSPPAR